jgi:DNA-binding CsgD family transcriptional regulator
MRPAPACRFAHADSTTTMIRYPSAEPSIIEDLYAGTLDESAWQRSMLGIADLASATGLVLFVFNPLENSVLRDEIYRFDPAVIANYRRNWVDKDFRLYLGINVPIDQPVIESRLLSSNELRRNDFQNDFLIREADAPHILAFWMQKSPRKVAAIALQGSARRGAFDRTDSERVQPLIPHVRRALEIRDRIESANVRADALNKSLDHLSFGVIVLDGQGRILEASTMATSMMTADSGIRRDADGSLALREPAGAQLRQWISSGSPPPENNDGLLRISQPIGAPICVMATPLPAVSTSWIAGDPRWLLLLYDTQRQVMASKEVIAMDLGITEREAELGALLLCGCSPAQAAIRLGISVHTVRHHLKSIFRKTGCRSQADLVQRIAKGPALFHKGRKS